MVIRLLAAVQMVLCVSALDAADTWALHTIDCSSKGADGVRLADINGDGRLDIVTGWEEGGQIRVCLQPIAAHVKERWPSVRVGSVKSPEDAVFADINGDGALDVVSCCEGKQQAIFFHINPGPGQLLKASAWKTTPLKASQNASRWMFCEPLADGTLIFGSKEPHGQIALLDVKAGTLQQLRRCGWIMSLRGVDIDGDGDEDVVYSDRKGKSRGIGWLENPGRLPNVKWRDHAIGGEGQEVMFMDISDKAEARKIACNTRNGHVLILTPAADVRKPWNVTTNSHPPGAGKAVAFADLNRDGRSDLVCTCGLAEGKFGAFWLEQATAIGNNGTPDSPSWIFHDISGKTPGIKYDRIEMIDLDSDGDLDLLTCEERDNLGVIWYENPEM